MHNQGKGDSKFIKQGIRTILGSERNE